MPAPTHLVPTLAATVASDETIGPVEETMPMPARTPADETLAHGVELSDTLGVGGMAVVRLGHQQVLERDVAVKTLRADKRGAKALERLVHEARIIGQLQHPNIVPIHDLRFDADGLPQILLKRIEGDPWSAILADDELLRAHTEDVDPLAWHVRVLIAVCNAVAFAHSREVIHRDIKPANVMIGAFGEVTLLDWGIALRLGAEASNPRLAGTPGYMAPEMLGREPLSIRTDVYLLGATLHELLTGKPPHPGNDLHAASKKLRSPPSLPSHVPATLGKLCLAALSVDPDDRPATVSEVRAVLEAFLEHRAVESIVRAARGRVESLRTAIMAEVDEREVLERLASCRLGFAQALDLWPEHPTARADLDEVLQLVCGWALSCGKLEAAAYHLAQVADPDPELVSAVASARAHERSRQRALEAQLADEEAAHRSRARLALPLGLPVIGLSVWMSLDAKPGYVLFATTSVIASLLVIAVAWRWRDSLASSKPHRRYLAVLAAMPMVQTLADIGGWLRGWPALQAHGVVLVVAMTAFLVIGIMQSRRYVLVAGVWGSLWIVSSLYPEFHYMLMGVGVGATVLVAMTLWAGPRPAPAREGG